MLEHPGTWNSIVYVRRREHGIVDLRHGVFPSMPLGVGQISLTNRFVDIVVCQCLDSCLVSETYVLYTAHFLTASTIYIVTC